MCGIAVQVSARGGVAPRQVLQHLAHRGPDAEGEWTNASQTAWLGHRRLAIVDLSPTGRQPMHNEEKTIWLVCNGEIYNYPVLRKELELAGHRFYSNCDCEAILHAYEQWGGVHFALCKIVEIEEGVLSRIDKRGGVLLEDG